MTIYCLISGKTTKTVGVIYVDDTNLWAGLDRDSNLLFVMDKGNTSEEQCKFTLVNTGDNFGPKK